MIRDSRSTSTCDPDARPRPRPRPRPRRSTSTWTVDPSTEVAKHPRASCAVRLGGYPPNPQALRMQHGGRGKGHCYGATCPCTESPDEQRKSSAQPVESPSGTCWNLSPSSTDRASRSELRRQPAAAPPVSRSPSRSDCFSACHARSSSTRSGASRSRPPRHRRAGALAISAQRGASTRRAGLDHSPPKAQS
jgi:hypothetical protein